MNKFFPFLIAILVFCNEANTICQVKVASGYLEKLYWNLPLDCRYVPSGNITFNKHTLFTKNIIRGNNIKINYYLSGNKIEDIGIAIIDPSIRNIIQSEDVSRFIERKILELMLIPNEYLLKILREDNLEIIVNNNNIVNNEALQKAYHIMTDKCNFKSDRDSLRYELHWVNSKNESVIFYFPATNTLIKAKDKKELDEVIIADSFLELTQCNS